MLCVTAFVLTAAPRVRFMIGGMPLYLVDVCAVVTLYFAMQATRPAWDQARKLRTAVLWFGGFVIAAQAGNAVGGGWLLVPTYMLVRYLLALSLFFSAQRLIASLVDLMLLAKAFAAGLAVTAFLICCVSLPPTRGVVTAYVFNNPFLEPVAEEGTISFGDEERAQRGRSLVGTSTLSGGFINTLWPFALLVAASGSVSSKWRLAAGLAALIAPFGAVMTYARGALLGLGIVVIAMAMLAKGKARQFAVITVVIAAGVFQWIGWDSDLFFFERYETRFAATLNSPYEDVRERERVLSYSEPFAHVAENPRFLLLGDGNSGGRRAPHPRADHSSDKATHSSFAWSYYGFGMAAALCNVFLFGYAVLTMYGAVRTAGSLLAPRGMMAMCLFASLLGMAPWWAFGHGTVSIPRGMMLYMLILGVTAAFANLHWNPTRWSGHLPTPRTTS